MHIPKSLVSLIGMNLKPDTMMCDLDGKKWPVKVEFVLIRRRRSKEIQVKATPIIIMIPSTSSHSFCIHSSSSRRSKQDCIPTLPNFLSLYTCFIKHIEGSTSAVLY